MFIYNLKLIIRRLKTNKLYSFLNITGFAIGFAVVLIIALYIYNESTVDRNFSDYQSIYRLISSEDNDCAIRFEAAQVLAEQYPEIEYSSPVQYLSGYSYNVGCEGKFASLDDIISTNNMFFRIFGFRIVEGNSGEPFPERNSAVISRRLSELLFGESSPLGKTIDVGGFIKTRITGVVEDFPPNTSFFSDLYLNIEDEKLRIMQSGDNGVLWHPAYIFLKLKDGTDKTNLDRKLSGSKIMLTYKEGSTWLQPLKDIYFDKDVEKNFNRTANTSMIYLFSAIAFLILFLSVANHVNFSIAFQFSRLRETGVKKTFGAGIRQLISFHLYENLAGLFLAFILAVFIVIEILPYAGNLLDRNLNAIDLTDYPVNILILMVILAVTILTSIVPIYLVRKFDIRSFMSGLSTKARGGSIYKVLTVFQATVSVILIICLIVIYKQLSFAKYSETGFDRKQLVRLVLPGNYDKGEYLKQEFSRLPFVRDASLSLGVPGMINSRAGSGEPDNEFWFNCIETDEDFIPTFGISLIEGRNFRQDDRDTVCIINETALKQYGWDEIENKKFKNLGLAVVGVVKDFNVSSFHDKIEPTVLILKNRFYNSLSIRLLPGNTAEQIASMKEAWEFLMPEYKFDFVFYDDFFESLYQKEEKEASAIFIFSVLALLITLMGMIGLIFQSCIVRSKEIGIRKINGASIPSIMTILISELMILVGVACIIGVPVAYYAMNRWLQNFAYRTELSWWIGAAGGILILTVSAITLIWQSWRAATRNPVDSLRDE